MKKTLQLLAVTVMLLISTVAFAQIPTLIPNTRVQDHANLIDAGQETLLDQKLKGLSDSKFIDLGLAVVDTTNGVAPVDFATQLGRTYGVGNAEGEHRGIVFLLAINDRQCFIAPSRHIEYVYTDGKMASLCRELRPFLRAQDYNGALNAATDKLIAMSADVDKVQATGVPNDAGAPAAKQSGGGGGFLLGLLGILLLIGLPVTGVVLFLRRRARLREEAEEQAERERQLAEFKRQEEEKRKAREAYLKTPEGIAETKRIEEQRRLAEERRQEELRLQRIKEDEEKKRYAIWAASAAGIAALALAAKEKKEAAERERKRQAEEAERQRKRRKEQEEQDEEDRRRRNSYSSSSYSSSSSSSSSDSGFGGGGFGGGSDFGGGGGGDSW